MKAEIITPAYVSPVSHIAVGTIVEVIGEVNDQYVLIRHNGFNYITHKSSLSYLMEAQEGTE